MRNTSTYSRRNRKEEKTEKQKKIHLDLRNLRQFQMSTGGQYKRN